VWHLKTSPCKRALPSGNEAHEKCCVDPPGGAARHGYETISVQGLKNMFGKKETKEKYQIPS